MKQPGPNATLEMHMKYMSDVRRTDEQMALARAKKVCESPIEELVYLYLWFHSHYGQFRFSPQKRIGPYRVDFLVEMDGKQFVVECDGHDFHEKTKEQAMRDKQRDRYLTAHGYVVLRFTGAEIVRDPSQVIRSVEDVVCGEWMRQRFGD